MTNFKPFSGYNKQEIMNTRGASLTPKQQHAIAQRNDQIYEMKEIGEWTNAQIARKFNLSKKYVKQIYKRYKRFKN